MTEAEKREAARQFYQKWAGRGREDEDDRSYWLDIFQRVLGVEAGKLVGRIYDALYKQYLNPENEQSQKSLNMLCVRLVFCLYCEDAGIFGDSRTMFHDYLDKFPVENMRKALIELFHVLDTKPEDRDPYDTGDLSKFPYVNGGLFADENIEIPNLTKC